MKDNRVLTGSLCALGCEVLYGLSYLFTKQTAETASPLALLGLAVCCCAGGDEPVCGAGIHFRSVERQTAWAAAARGAVLPVPVFHRRNGGHSRNDGDGERRFSGLRSGAVSAGLDGHFEKEPHQTADYRHFGHVFGRDDDGCRGRPFFKPVACGVCGADAGGCRPMRCTACLSILRRITRRGVTYVMLCSGAAFYGLLALGEAAAHGALSELLTLPARSGTVSDGGALSGHRLFGCGVFPVQCGDCKNRREQNVLVYRRIHDRFHSGRRAALGEPAERWTKLSAQR